MPSLEIGRVCMKVVGREAGKYCVIVKNINKSFAEVSGPRVLTGIKRRRVNITHIEPTQYAIEIKENASDEEILAAFKKANLTTKLDLKEPSAAEIKEHTKAENKEMPAQQKQEKKKSKKKE